MRKKEIDMSQSESLRNEVSAAITEMKDDEHHKKSPSLLKFLRLRLEKSLEIYSKYVVAS